MLYEAIAKVKAISSLRKKKEDRTFTKTEDTFASQNLFREVLPHGGRRTEGENMNWKLSKEVC